jgi:hypothetical protein
MKAKILVGTIATLALGTAGVALAEGTAGQTKDKSAHETQQYEQGATSATEGTEGSETGTAGQADIGSEQQAVQREQTAQTKSGINRLDSVKLSVLDEESAQNLQTKLQELGYYKAEVDGKVGPKTRAALSQFFRDQAQLVNRGRLSELAMTSLGFDDSEIERVRGMEEEPVEGQRSPTRGVEEDESIEGGTGIESGTEGSGIEGSGTQGTGTQGSQGTMPDVEP